MQATANGFAFMGSMNQTKEDKDKHGMVQDYHILPQLFTFERQVATIETEERMKKEAVMTRGNSNVVRMITGG